MKSKVSTVNEYLDSLPEDRCLAIKTVLDAVRESMPMGYEEVLNWGMICWQVPLSYYPDTYNKQPFMYAALASQKNYMSLYLMVTHANPELDKSFRKDYEATGKKLDMGKGCVRFKKLEDLSLDVVKKYIASQSMEDFVARIR